MTTRRVLAELVCGCVATYGRGRSVEARELVERCEAAARRVGDGRRDEQTTKEDEA